MKRTILILLLIAFAAIAWADATELIVLKVLQPIVSAGTPNAVRWDATNDAVLWDASGDKVLWD